VFGAAGSEIDRAELGLWRVLATATAVMAVLSWPLWAGTGGLARVPFLAGLPRPPAFADGLAACGLVASLLLAGLQGRGRRYAYASALTLLAALVVEDQHRLQAWAYQFVAVGFFLAALPRGEGLRAVRWWFAALYLHSGLSKLDASFCQELGPVFLRTAVAPLGLDPSRWPAAARTAAVLAMPAWEVAVAAALVMPRGRRWGRVGAAAFHGALVVVLGPLGLGHSAIVVVWNVALLFEVWIAFGPDLAAPAAAPVRSPRRWPVWALFWAGVLLPFGERWGAFDAWPSHALYASHVERLRVLIHESEVMRYPEAVRGHLRPGGGVWRSLDLTGWSRSARGTPVYPQNRACLGLGESLAARYGGRLVRVVAFGPADRWTGRRERVEAVGLTEIRRLGRRFRLNARPADGSGIEKAKRTTPHGEG